MAVARAMELFVVPKSIPTARPGDALIEDMKGYYGAGGGLTVRIETDLAVIAEQERTLVFAHFGAEEAWAVGCRLREEALRRRAGMTFEIQIAGRTLFLAATEGASAGQMDWIRRKRNVVMRFGKSSYAVGLELEAAGLSIEARHGLTLADYAMHGGGFPIALKRTVWWEARSPAACISV